MADLYSNTGDGICFAGNQSSWAAARDAGVAASVSTTSTHISTMVFAGRGPTRGGGIYYAVNRSFYYFDTSGITGTVSSATFKIYGSGSATDGSIIAVKSTAFGGDGGDALDARDFPQIVGHSAGSSVDGTGDYSANIQSGWNTSGYNDLASTALLRTDMQDDDVVIICVMDYTNDYKNVALTSNATLDLGGYYTDNTGTSKDPYITYEVAASGYGNIVNGVAAASIGKVDGVATADIEKVIGV